MTEIATSVICAWAGANTLDLMRLLVMWIAVSLHDVMRI